jgi:putative DNA primase/helicase
VSSAQGIAVALGLLRRSGRWWRCVCPIHGSRTGRSLSLALRDGERGLIVKCFAGCGPRDILAELHCRGLLGDAPRGGELSIVDRAADRRECERRIEIARRLWSAARDARGSPVAHYIAGRGITTIPVPTSLRYTPAMRRPDGTEGPAIVSRVDDVDGQLIGIHRTWRALKLAWPRCRRP